MSKALKNITKLKDTVDVVADFGADPTGSVDSTAAIQAALSSGALNILLPSGSYLSGQLTIPSVVRLYGYGATLNVKAALNNSFIVNTGGTGITLEGFSINGNYATQTSGSSIVFTSVTNCVVKNVTINGSCGTGILFAAATGCTVNGCVINNCGMTAAGYGIYFFQSSYNVISNNITSNNCMGIVVESSGVAVSLYNAIVGNISTANRAAFTQSGAGIHLECSAGNNVGYTIVSGNNASTNGGPGINQTNGTNNNITGNNCSNNAYSGITTNAAVNTLLSGNLLTGNATSAASGYKCGILFDSASTGSTGIVSSNIINGSVTGIKTFGLSSLSITGNDVRGNSSTAITISGISTDVTANNKGYDWFDREPNPPVVLFDDFTDLVVSSKWNSLKGSDAGCALPTVVTNSVSGNISMLQGAGAGATMAVNGVQIAGALNYFPATGRLVFEARFAQMSVLTNTCFFVGFTNQVSALQMPIEGSGVADGITYNSTNACGVLFDTRMATQNWWLVGMNNSVAGTPQNSGVSPIASTYETWRVEVPSSGNLAYFFRNGVLIGTSMTNGISAGLAVAPVIAGYSRAAVGKISYIDYIKCEQFGR